MKVHAITLGFVPERIARESIARFYNTKSTQKIEHHFLNQHYPLDKEQNTAKLREVCKEFGLHWHDAGKNLGLHEGFNFVLRTINPSEDDIIIGFDPDCNPVTPSWDRALVDVLQNPDYAWASLRLLPAFEHLDKTKQFKRNMFRGVKVREIGHAVINSICAFRADWLMSVGGLYEENKFYGGLEVHMWPKLKNKKWVFLEDFEETHELMWTQDEAYRKYKVAHAHERSWPGDFESWLAAHK